MKQANKSVTGNKPAARGRKRSSDGVIATLERLSGQSPCPDYLRDGANKFLRNKDFLPFPAMLKKRVDLRKLTQPHAEQALMNALLLDEVLDGATEQVVGLVAGNVRKEAIGELLKRAKENIDRRAGVYAYWQQRLPLLSSLLLDRPETLRTQRLDELLEQAAAAPSTVRPAPFALRAIRQQEALERHGRRGELTALQLMEQADAYLALDDLAMAEDKAAQAIARDAQQPRAWFIRVVAALKQRNSALAQARRHRFEAVEMADPMSAHERMLHAESDRAESQAYHHQVLLDQLLPQALLQWPKDRDMQHAHAHWRRQVAELMVQQAFGKLALGGAQGYSRRAYALNGMAPEMHLKYDDPSAGTAYMMDGPGPVPLREDERAALALLFEEHARQRHFMSAALREDFLRQDFYLLHLRWVLGDSGYAWHWQVWSEDAAGFPPAQFEAAVLQDGVLRALWFSHQARQGGIASARQALEQLHERICRQRDERSSKQQLDMHVMVYHHQLARQDVAGCWQTCIEAERLSRTDVTGYGALHAHPYEANIMIPAGHLGYWQYLKALTAVLARCAGVSLDAEADAVIADAEHWRETFCRNDAFCWIYGEEYEEGGGEDYPVAPYDIDLREAAMWVRPVRGGEPGPEPIVVSLCSSNVGGSLSSAAAEA